MDDYYRAVRLWLADVEALANGDSLYAAARLDGSTAQLLDLALEAGVGVWP